MNESFKQVSAGVFKELFDTGKWTLIDVRTPGELPVYGIISESQTLIDINNSDFVTKIGELDKNRKYLVYCWHGTRSVVARNYMQQQGFKHVLDLQGGIEAWKNLVV